MKKITQQELDKIIADHQIFLKKMEMVERINLKRMNPDLAEKYIDFWETNESRLKATLFKADLSGLDFKDADLSFSDFSSCNLSNANLFNCNFFCAVLNDADLSGAKLFNNNLEYAFLENCIITGK